MAIRTMRVDVMRQPARMAVRHQDTTPVRTIPPLSTAIRRSVGVILILAGVLNGGAQYFAHLVVGDSDTTVREDVVWGVEHPVVFGVEQYAMQASVVLLLLGCLGIAQVTRWKAPRLTAVATVLVVVGTWGFQNLLALELASESVAPSAIGVDRAVDLAEAMYADTGVWATALGPHIVGSFLGVLLLGVAALRSFPKPAVVLLLAFLVWDFLLPSIGPLEAHLLLLVALVWFGVHILRMPQATWLGGSHAAR
jgi:hypothetical protein